MQTVKYWSPSGKITSIAARINKSMKLIDDCKKKWAGTGDEFRRWAKETMTRQMKNFSFDLLCNTPDSEIGNG